MKPAKNDAPLPEAVGSLVTLLWNKVFAYADSDEPTTKMRDDAYYVDTKLRAAIRKYGDERAAQENAALRRWRCDNDCRFTMGDVADLSGRHCPLDKPCVRCSTEGEVEGLRSLLDRAVPIIKEHACGESVWLTDAAAWLGATP